jgi:hypothetical protein
MGLPHRTVASAVVASWTPVRADGWTTCHQTRRLCSRGSKRGVIRQCSPSAFESLGARAQIRQGLTKRQVRSAWYSCVNEPMNVNLGATGALSLPQSRVRTPALLAAGRSGAAWPRHLVRVLSTQEAADVGMPDGVEGFR